MTTSLLKRLANKSWVTRNYSNCLKSAKEIRRSCLLRFGQAASSAGKYSIVRLRLKIQLTATPHRKKKSSVSPRVAVQDLRWE